MPANRLTSLSGPSPSPSALALLLARAATFDPPHRTNPTGHSNSTTQPTTLPTTNNTNKTVTMAHATSGGNIIDPIEEAGARLYDLDYLTQVSSPPPPPSPTTVIPIMHPSNHSQQHYLLLPHTTFYHSIAT